MEQQEESLTGKQRLVYEACCKIQQGERLIAEGKLELDNLIKNGAVKGSRTGIPSKSAKTKKTVANRSLREPSMFKPERRSDEELKKKILELLEKEDEVTANLIHRKLRISDRRIGRLSAALSDKITFEKKGYKNVWKLNKPTVAMKGKRGQPVNVADWAPKVLDFLKGKEWVNKSILEEGVGLSRIPLDKVLAYLVKNKKVKSVEKAQNPAHKQPKNYFRPFTYWELV